MFFKKKKPWVKFVNSMPGVEIAHPVMKAHTHNFEWFKTAALDYKKRKNYFDENPNHHLLSATRCPGLQQFFKSGFIVSNPIDFTIETKKENAEYFRWGSPTNGIADGQDYISSHSPSQLADFMPFREDTLKTLIKIQTRWKIYSSSDIVFLQIPIAYPDHNMFTAAHGIVDPQIALELNVILFWHKLDGIHLVKAGTPLFYLIPIPRDLSIDFEVSRHTEEDTYKGLAYTYLHRKEWNKDIKSFIKSSKKLLGSKDQ